MKRMTIKNMNGKQVERSKRMTKNNSLTIRIEPEIRFGLELLARQQRRTLSAVIGWVIQREIDGCLDMDKLWDVDELVRIDNLSKYAPNLLTYEEQVYLKELENDG